jgi:hypothetical protein
MKETAAAPAAAEKAGPKHVPWPTMTVTLEHPVTDEDGAEIAAISFHEPDVEALERLEEIDAAEGERLKVRHLRFIAAVLSRQPDAVIRKVHAKDFAKIVEAISPFLEYVVKAAPPSGP